MKKILIALAILVAATPVALAQSAYTSGSASSNARSGYPSPYGGYGRGYYDSSSTTQR
jgi:hypothetical protein